MTNPRSVPIIFIIVAISISSIGLAGAQEMAYDGVVTELAIRRVNADQDLMEFAALRDSLVGVLTDQDGVVCNAIALDNDGNIYLSNVGLAADVITINRVSDEVSVWIADDRWPNDSGFGLSGIAFDGDASFYVHFSGGVFQIALNEDGSAGEAVMQSLVDADGNATTLPGVDGLAWAGNGTLLFYQFQPRNRRQ